MSGPKPTLNTIARMSPRVDLCRRRQPRPYTSNCCRNWRIETTASWSSSSRATSDIRWRLPRAWIWPRATRSSSSMQICRTRPEVIHEFVAKWREGYDVVFAIRKQREGETWLKLTTAKYFYRLLRYFTKTDIPADVGDFRLLSRRAADALRGLREHDRFVRGLVSWIGFRQTGIYYERDRRFAGKTKYSWRQDDLVRHGRIDLVLDRAAAAGDLAGLRNGLCRRTLPGQRHRSMVGRELRSQGWATIMVGLLFIGSVQLICLGIIGEYIGRVFVATQGPAAVFGRPRLSRGRRVSSGRNRRGPDAFRRGRRSLAWHTP